LRREFTRPVFRRTDFLVILGIIILVGIIVAYNNARPSPRVLCEILVNNTVVRTVDLLSDAQFLLPEHEAIRFSVKNGAIAFVESDCPDKVCVHTGYISKPGQAAVCLPNRVAVRISGATVDLNAPDVVTQ
jgi:hypothetical protein